jgi:hypothetical protein
VVEPFLQRWSARKQQAKKSDELPDELPDERYNSPVSGDSNKISDDVLTVSPHDTEQVLQEQPAQELTDTDMPPLDSLTTDSDYQQFFAPKVSAELRRLALNKLFHLPQFNIRDGLDDFDDDFTQFEPLGDTVTADMKHRIEMLRQREQREQEEQRKQVAEAEAQEALSADDQVAADATPESTAPEPVSEQQAKPDPEAEPNVEHSV